MTSVSSPYIELGFAFGLGGGSLTAIFRGVLGSTVFFEKVENQKCILNLNIPNHSVAKKNDFIKNIVPAT